MRDLRLGCLTSKAYTWKREHLGIALALNVPVMVVITKIDICPPQILQQTIKQLTMILKSPGARKIPIFIKTKEECINTAVCSALIISEELLTLGSSIETICQSENMSCLSGFKRYRRVFRSCSNIS